MLLALIATTASILLFLAIARRSVIITPCPDAPRPPISRYGLATSRRLVSVCPTWSRLPLRPCSSRGAQVLPPRQARSLTHRRHAAPHTITSPRLAHSHVCFGRSRSLGCICMPFRPRRHRLAGHDHRKRSCRGCWVGYREEGHGGGRYRDARDEH